MARPKSAFRKRFNVRWLRWVGMRSLCLALPPLGRLLSFPINSVVPRDFTTRIIERCEWEEVAQFTPRQIEEVVRPGVEHEGNRAGRPLERMDFTCEVALLPGCAVLGHTGTTVRSADVRMISKIKDTIPNWNFAKPALLRRLRFSGHKVTSLLGSDQYYHFFANRILPFLHYLHHHHQPGEPITALIPARLAGYQREACKAIRAAWPEVRFETLGRDERAEIDNYLWIYLRGENGDWMPVTRGSAGQLVSLMRAHYRLGPPQGGKRLFFSRGNVKIRRLVNEDELLEIAKAHGFEPFVADAGNHAEQVRRFGEADVIIAVHGAGLANLLFARPGTRVIEIFPENFIKSTYLWLALRLGMTHHAVVGSRGDYDQTFRLDPERFSRVLEEALCGEANMQELSG